MKRFETVPDTLRFDLSRPGQAEALRALMVEGQEMLATKKWKFRIVADSERQFSHEDDITPTSDGEMAPPENYTVLSAASGQSI